MRGGVHDPGGGGIGGGQGGAGAGGGGMQEEALGGRFEPWLRQGHLQGNGPAEVEEIVGEVDDQQDQVGCLGLELGLDEQGLLVGAVAWYGPVHIAQFIGRQLVEQVNECLVVVDAHPEGEAVPNNGADLPRGDSGRLGGWGPRGWGWSDVGIGAEAEFIDGVNRVEVVMALASLPKRSEGPSEDGVEADEAGIEDGRLVEVAEVEAGDDFGEEEGGEEGEEEREGSEPAAGGGTARGGHIRGTCCMDLIAVGGGPFGSPADLALHPTKLSNMLEFLSSRRGYTQVAADHSHA